MSNSRKPLEDDDNDSVLFDRLQEHVLRHHPNPRRIGCPSSDVLAAFVEEPASVSLEQLNELHIMQCAECTRELIELRHIRELKDKPAVPELVQRVQGTRYTRWAVAAILLIATGLVVFQNLRSRRSSLEDAQVASVRIDLSGEGPARSFPNDSQSLPQLRLPRRKIMLRLKLPYFSPGGHYSIQITGGRSLDSPIVATDGYANSIGADTELDVVLDLRKVPAGSYYLGTVMSENGSGPNFYPLRLE